MARQGDRPYRVLVGPPTDMPSTSSHIRSCATPTGRTVKLLPGSRVCDEPAPVPEAPNSLRIAGLRSPHPDGQGTLNPSQTRRATFAPLSPHKMRMEQPSARRESRSRSARRSAKYRSRRSTIRSWVNSPVAFEIAVVFGTVGSAAIADLLRNEGITDIRNVTRRMHGCDVTLYFTVDQAEVARREAAGFAAIEDEEVVRHLATLPIGVQTPFAFLDEDALPYLVTAGSELVHLDIEGLTRLAKAPLEMQVASIAAPNWHAAADALSELASAVLCVVELDKASPEVEINASLFGYGLVTGNELIMAPEGARSIEAGVRWELGETVYAESWLPRPEFE